MFDYSFLAALLAVAREGSFERAARLLGVTSSAISQRIKQLEDRIGCVVLVRGAPCRPTIVGEVLCRHLEQVMLLEQDLRRVLPGLTQETRPALLRMGVDADSLSTWLIPALADFAGLSPSALEIILDDESQTLDRLRTGAIRAAVTRQPRSINGYDHAALGQLRYRAVASPVFAERYFPHGVMHKSLTMTPLLRLSGGDLMPMQWMHKFGKRWNWPPNHRLATRQAVLEATLAGMGWSLIPVEWLERPLAEGALVTLAPNTDLLVPLYWHATRLAVPTLMRLTSVIAAAATARLEPMPQARNRHRRPPRPRPLSPEPG